MINTNLLAFSSDMEEEVDLFVSRNDLNVDHHFIREGNKITNRISFLGKVYEYTDEISYNDPLEEKRLIKRYAKLAVYKALSAHFNKTMPWGALTGIRPTKLAYKEGDNYKRFFKETMLVSEEKTSLIADILEAQKGIYEKNDDNADFFAGIPFCPTKCSYCSFVSCEIDRVKDLIPKYTDALVKEIEESKKLVKNLRSVYIGGGTPVALPIEELKKVLEAIGKQTVEYTVEAGRPDCITEENLAILKEYGVTRICVNPQTFSDKTLRLLGRRHTANDVLTKYALAKGQFDINMDLIAGLPEEEEEDFKFSLDKAISLDPENITVHTLCLKKGSRLKENTSRLAEDRAIRMVEYAHKALKEAGYLPYYLYRQKYMAGNLENTGYTKPGKACVYNVDIMEEIAQNVACGANAVSKAVFSGGERIERIGNPKDIITYINKLPLILEEKRRLFS